MNQGLGVHSQPKQSDDGTDNWIRVLKPRKDVFVHYACGRQCDRPMKTCPTCGKRMSYP